MNIFWKDVRVVDGAVLESERTQNVPGVRIPLFPILIKTLSMSPGAMQEITTKPRQVRKKAAVGG